MSDDGRFLLGVSHTGWTQQRMNMDRVPAHAAVVDLTDLSVDLPMPLTYRTPGVEREHASPCWIRHQRHHGQVDVADDLLVRATPAVVPPDDAGERQQRASNFRALSEACARAQQKLQQPGWPHAEVMVYRNAAEQEQRGQMGAAAQQRPAGEQVGATPRRRGLFGRRSRPSA